MTTSASASSSAKRAAPSGEARSSRVDRLPMPVSTCCAGGSGSAGGSIRARPHRGGRGCGSRPARRSPGSGRALGGGRSGRQASRARRRSAPAAAAVLAPRRACSDTAPGFRRPDCGGYPADGDYRRFRRPRVQPGGGSARPAPRGDRPRTADGSDATRSWRGCAASRRGTARSRRTAPRRTSARRSAGGAARWSRRSGRGRGRARPAPPVSAAEARSEAAASWASEPTGSGPEGADLVAAFGDGRERARLLAERTPGGGEDGTHPVSVPAPGCPACAPFRTPPAANPPLLSFRSATFSCPRAERHRGR